MLYTHATQCMHFIIREWITLLGLWINLLRSNELIN